MKYPRRLFIIQSPDSLSYQVCKDDEELSTPYISLAEHDARMAAMEKARDTYEQNWREAALSGIEVQKQYGKYETQISEASERVSEQAGYIARLELQIKNPGGSFCAYCQHHFKSNTTEADRLKIAEHALDCDKSPLRTMTVAAMFYEDVLNRVVSEHSSGHTMGFDCKTCLILSEFINSQQSRQDNCRCPMKCPEHSKPTAQAGDENEGAPCPHGLRPGMSACLKCETTEPVCSCGTGTGQHEPGCGTLKQSGEEANKCPNE